MREKFSCRSCEAITQPPAPSHPIARGRAGPVLLAEIAFGKFCLHLPLHRQSRSFAREGVEIDVSTMADWMGAVSVALKPMVEIIEAHVLAAQRLHVDDTPVPVLAKGKTKTGRLWTVVRDDRPYGGADPPAALYVYSPDRAGAHPEAFLRTWSGIMQADAYAGFNKLYEPGRLIGAILEAGCWAHWRRKFYEIAALKKAPIAVEAVTRIDAIFAIERTINGSTPAERQAVRDQTTRPLVGGLVAWLDEQRRALSPKSETAKAMDYGLKRMLAFTRFLDDGRICLSNSAAERAMRCVAIGRKNWTFAGSDAGGRRTAAIYTLIETCMCGWPPRCKSFVWAMRDKSAACMCPAYIRRHAWPPAQMRSADRVHYKLSRSRRLQVCWVSRSRLSTIASSSHSAPLHHDRQDPACPCGLFLCCPVRLLPGHHCPDDSSHLVGQGDRSEFDWLAGDNPSQPAVREVLLAA